MKAFFKTLFGDWLNLGFVAVVVAVEVGLIHGGYTREACIVVPMLILAGIAWLAGR